MPPARRANGNTGCTAAPAGPHKLGGAQGVGLSPPPHQDTPKREKMPPALPSRAGAGSTCPSSLQRGDLQGDHDPRLHRPNERHCRTQRARGHLAALPAGTAPAPCAHPCSRHSHPSPASSTPRSSSPHGTAGPCRLKGETSFLTPPPPAAPGVWGAQGGGTARVGWVR